MNWIKSKARLAIGYFFVVIVQAAESPVIGNLPQNKKPYEGIDSSHFVESFLSLFLVLGVIFVAAWVLKRFKGIEVTGKKHLKVVESLSLGTKEKVAVVKCGEEYLLLGVTPNQISHLKTLNQLEYEEVEAAPSFRSLLEKATGIQSDEQTEGPAGDKDQINQHHQKDEDKAAEGMAQESKNV